MRRTILLLLLPAGAAARSSLVRVSGDQLEVRSTWSPNGEFGSAVLVQAVQPAGVIVAFYNRPDSTVDPVDIDLGASAWIPPRCRTGRS